MIYTCQVLAISYIVLHRQALVVQKLQEIQWRTLSIALLWLLATQHNREKVVPRVVEGHSFSRPLFIFS